ncbi:hypothetical protein KSP39_PZI020489 [Platanthera zijinensis]|uniref:Uncharacterized protein n=1 Tax=Platanthera zijinensis TaxID=2320716 RepID=A0AAP0FXF5_9ASPA
MNVVGIIKCLVFSARTCWRFICRHPFVSGLVLFMLFLYRYFPSIFIFLIYSFPVIACTSLLLGALLIYGEPYITEPEDMKGVDVSVKSERCITEENLENRRVMSASKDGHLKQMHDDGNGQDNTVLAAGSSGKNAEKELHNEKTVINEVGTHDQKFIEKVFSVENPAECSLRTAEGLNVEIGKPLDKHFESSLGSPWQKVNGHEGSSGSESDGEESSLSPDTSMADIIPIIDELNPLLESENPHRDHRSIDSSDAISGVSSPELESDDGSAEEETENLADEEEEDAREEKDNNESVVKWTADDEKNLMDLGSLELERNRRLENLIAKRRAKKLQRFQTDKNLIDLDTEPLPFMEEISRFNVQIPAISAPRRNPFDLLFDSEESIGVPPIPGSAPSVLLPRRNPFDLPYDQDEENSKLAGDSSKPFNEPKIKPYFVLEKNIGTDLISFKRQLSEKSDSKESSASESNSVSEVVSQDHNLSESETHERLSSVNQDVETVDQESDLSVQVGSEHEQNVADSVEIGEMESSSPVSSTENLELIDERYHGSGTSYSEEDDKYSAPRNHIEPAKSVLPVKGPEGADDSQIADPVYDSSPSAMSTLSHIPLLDEHLFSKVKGKEGLITGSSLASDEGDFISDEVHANLKGIKSVDNASNSDMNIVDNFLVEEIMPGSEVWDSELQSSKQLGSRIVEFCKETAMEQPRALEPDGGSSSMALDPKLKMKNANLPISEPSVDGNDRVQKSSQETVPSSSSESTANNSKAPGNAPNSLDPKDQIELLV